MDTTLEAMPNSHNSPQPAIPVNTTLLILQWTQKLTLVAGIVGLAVYFLAQPVSTLLLSAACVLVAASSFLGLGLRWRDHKRTTAQQNWPRYSHIQEVMHRIETGYDVVSPVIPTIEVDGQTLVVLRSWSMGTGKATLILDRNGRAVQDQGIWQKSAVLIAFSNACLPSVSRNRRAIIHTNLFARNQAARAWDRALKDNLGKFTHLGLGAECQALIEHWEVLETFLSLRIALFQAEESAVERIDNPASDQEQILAWIEAQRQLHLKMESLKPGAEKIAAASTRLLTGWLENKSEQDWKRSDELEAGLKFAYLLQSLLVRTLNRWEELERPDMKTFQRGLELARETGLMITPSE